MSLAARASDLHRDFSRNPRILLLSGLALVLGVVGATLAWILLRLIALCTNLFYYQRLSWEFVSPAQNHLHLLSVFVPVIGGLIIGLMARFGSEKIRGHGIPEALESILMNGAKISPRVALFKPLGSAVAIGSGGPFGAEGPIIMTAGSAGSLFAQFFHLTDAERTTLLVAGAAAGMAGVFSTPLAAVLLAVELLLFEWRPRSFIPVAIAAVVAGVLRRYFLASDPLFPMPALNHPASPAALLGAVAVGLAGGALALALSRAVYASEDLFEHHLHIHWMWWPAIGGVVVGLGGLIFPRALGTGYDVIDTLLGGDQTWQLIAGVLAVKSILWSFSLGSGTSGGILAPLLMIGGALGALLAPVLPGVSVGAWPLVGMTAVLSGSIGCPLTAAVLSLELTHNYGMLLPVFAGSVTAHAFTVFFQKRSILTERLGRRGHHLSREYSVDPLEIILVSQVVRDNAVAAAATRANMLPESMVAYPYETLRAVAERMAMRRLFVLPVADPESGQLIGIIDTTDILIARERAHKRETRMERPRTPFGGRRKHAAAAVRNPK